jgi:hypothetical protein
MAEPNNIEQLKSSIRSLEGVRTENTYMSGIFDLYLETIHPCVSFYKNATEMGGINQISTLRYLFGKWNFKGDRADTGDLVFVKSPFIENSEGWGMMIQQNSDTDMEVLFPTSQYTSKIVKNVPLEIQLIWKPSFETTIPPNSPQAEYWGPMTSKLKNFLENPPTYSCDEFLNKVLKGKGYLPTTAADFKSKMKEGENPQLLEVTETNKPNVGDLVFGEDIESIGIYLADKNIIGINPSIERYKTNYYETKLFKPKFFWIPVESKA